ncbi:calcium-binding protein [Solicola gregarius]|uniref:Calcium-binding protein n=1 Tax=Solicola gregarius TaxID=2908642 RepID=A0AA46TEL2_9ACTN|nr:calcium-binding protein [Solicola gregarius]UYM03377.1 hypothetical protein L0C25_12495 [Solicola gregarius]
MIATRSGGFVTAVAMVISITAVGTAQATKAEETQDAPKRCHGHQVTIHGTKDDDRIAGTPGRDVIDSGNGDDTIKARGGNDIVCAGKGADALFGGSGRDLLDGGPDRVVKGFQWRIHGDRFIGGPGNDRMIGGGDKDLPDAAWWRSRDRVEFPGATGAITVGKRGVVRGPGVGRDRLLGGMQRISGTRWADDITVRGDWDVAARDGNDRVRVLPGRHYNQFWPLIEGQGGDDRLDASRADRTNYYHELDGGTGRDRLIGSDHDDRILDPAGAGVVRAGGGKDDQVRAMSRMTVFGQGGRDVIQLQVRKGRLRPINGGAGRDRLGLTQRFAGDIDVRVPAHRLRIGRRETRLRSVEGFGLRARNADVRFVGGKGSQDVSTLLSKGQVARIRLGAGNDRYEHTNGRHPRGLDRTVVHGGTGSDTLFGGDGPDRLFGGRGDDGMYGYRANDRLRGGKGRDTSGGGGGNDLCRAEKKRNCER